MPVKQTPEGGYDVSVCVNYRRAHRRLPPGTSASDAKSVEAELRVALKPKAKPIAGDPALTVLLAAYIAHCDADLRSPDTATHHAMRIWKWLEGKRASEVRGVVAKIKKDMLPHYKPATINRSLGALKTSLSMAWEAETVGADYSSLVKRLPENNERHVYRSMAQIKKLADAASFNTRVAIWVALLTGCRRGEVCKIEREKIGRNTIEIPAGNTKKLRYRTVVIVPALRPWLKHLPLAISYEGVKSGFRRAREAVGDEGLHFHDLRHSCATILLGLGTPLHVVRDILGHQSIKSTERYAHAMVQPQRDAMKKLGAMHVRTMNGGR